jgi:hypothetical protein
MNRSRALAAATLTTAALLLAGCGGAAPPDIDQPPATTSAAPATTAAAVGSGSGGGERETPARTPAQAASSADGKVDQVNELGDGLHSVLVMDADAAGNRITVDSVRIFTGAAAEKAAAEDGEQATDEGADAWYARNVNPRPSEFRVQPGLEIALWSTPDADARIVHLTDLAGGQGDGWLFQMQVTGGVVTGMDGFPFE